MKINFQKKIKKTQPARREMEMRIALGFFTRNDMRKPKPTQTLLESSEGKKKLANGILKKKDNWNGILRNVKSVVQRETFIVSVSLKPICLRPNE